MASPDTFSIPVVTASAHEHAWVTASMHATSGGRIRYVRCVSCEAWRVDVDAAPGRPPLPHTRVVGADDGGKPRTAGPRTR